MELTSHQIEAMDFQKRWLTATGTIREQRKEIDSLKDEVTRLQQENYRLRDEVHDKSVA